MGNYLSRVVVTVVTVGLLSPSVHAADPVPYVNTKLKTYGRTLTAAEIYQRCTQKLADTYFRTNAFMTAQLAALSKTPTDLTKATDACIYLLRQGTMINDTDKGSEVSLTGEGLEGAGKSWPAAERASRTDAGLHVLRTMNAFHQNYFTSRDFTNFAGLQGQTPRDLIDVGEPAYFLTWALLGRDGSGKAISFPSILKRNQGLRAVRRSTAASATFPGTTSPLAATRNYCFDIRQRPVNCETAEPASIVRRENAVPAGVYVLDEVSGDRRPELGRRHRRANLRPEDFVPVGQLWGLQDSVPLKINQVTSTTGTNRDLVFNGNVGGGILGSTAYTMMNWSSSGAQDGGKRIPRKWSAHVMRDFLCIDSFPNLLATDVVDQIEPTGELEFRKSASCMACHAAADPLAFTARNQVFAETGSTQEDAIFRSAPTMLNVPVTEPAEVGLVPNTDPLFSRRPPNGELFFRNRLDKIVRVKLNGLADLGQRLTEQDDFYVCAAKKYYEFLTGVSINIRKPASSSTDVEKEHLENIRLAGLEVLKKTGSLEQMIRFIMNTPAFRSSDFRAEAQK